MKLCDLFEHAKDMKTLYCSRELLNGDELVKWAKEQGFEKCLDPKDMHVTVAYSTKPVDWSDMTDSFDHVYAKVNPNNPEKTKREIKLFGDKKDAVVLTFKCGDLEHRWQEFMDDFGTSWDHDGYHPHVTISYDGLPEGLNLEDIEPFQGELRFGPEIMQPVKTGWKASVKETTLESVGAIDPTDTKQFKEWFQNSKVATPDGKPIVVYHGTSAKFRSFNMKKQVMGIIWFTSNKNAIEAGEVGAQGKGHILDLYASIQNPADWNAYDKLGLWELQSRGYDGAILPEKDGTFTGFVFNPGQLKSVKNKGNFDRHNKNLNEINKKL